MAAGVKKRTFSIVLLALASACSASGSREAPSPNNLVVLNWFTSASESSAMNALLGLTHEQDPRLNITNAAQENSADQQTILANEIAAGNPPDSFQVVSGNDLFEWVNRGALEPLDALYTSQGWSATIPPPVLDLVKKSGSLYGVPLDIERDNTLFYNKAILAAQGLRPPRGIGEVASVAAALGAKNIVAFAVSDSGGWTIASHLFESVLVAQAGPDFYRAYLTGTKTADTTEIRAALGTVAAMMDSANADRTMTAWYQAVAKVCAGQAAMLILPDFVRGEFAKDGCGPDVVDYVAMEPAGTPTFVFGSVTFELPKGAADRSAAMEFLTTVGSKLGQETFNPIKGSIPGRTDVDATIYASDPIAAHTLSDFTLFGEQLVPAYAALTASEFQKNVNAALQSFVDSSSGSYKSIDSVVAVIAQNYPLLHP
jgi:glucose/mannose transport system substrate-binding protein